MQRISIELDGRYRHARTVRRPADLALRNNGKNTSFVVPELNDYELVLLE